MVVCCFRALGWLELTVVDEAGCGVVVGADGMGKERWLGGLVGWVAAVVGG